MRYGPFVRGVHVGVDVLAEHGHLVRVRVRVRVKVGVGVGLGVRLGLRDRDMS